MKKRRATGRRLVAEVTFYAVLSGLDFREIFERDGRARTQRTMKAPARIPAKEINI
jgi:hypothetical protein